MTGSKDPGQTRAAHGPLSVRAVRPTSGGATVPKRGLAVPAGTQPRRARRPGPGRRPSWPARPPRARPARASRAASSVAQHRAQVVVGAAVRRVEEHDVVRRRAGRSGRSATRARPGRARPRRRAARGPRRWRAGPRTAAGSASTSRTCAAAPRRAPRGRPRRSRRRGRATAPPGDDPSSDSRWRTAPRGRGRTVGRVPSPGAAPTPPAARATIPADRSRGSPAVDPSLASAGW